LKKNLISIGALEALGLEIPDRDGIFKMLRDLIVMMKGIRHNNLYYLKGNTATWQVTTSIISNNDCTRLWHMRLGHTSKKSSQALTK